MIVILLRKQLKVHKQAKAAPENMQQKAQTARLRDNKKAITAKIENHLPGKDMKTGCSPKKLSLTELRITSYHLMSRKSFFS